MFCLVYEVLAPEARFSPTRLYPATFVLEAVVECDITQVLAVFAANAARFSSHFRSEMLLFTDFL